MSRPKPSAGPNPTDLGVSNTLSVAERTPEEVTRRAAGTCRAMAWAAVQANPDDPQQAAAEWREVLEMLGVVGNDGPGIGSCRSCGEPLTMHERGHGRRTCRRCGRAKTREARRAAA